MTVHGATFSKVTLLTIDSFDFIKNIKLKFAADCTYTLLFKMLITQLFCSLMKNKATSSKHSPGLCPLPVQPHWNPLLAQMFDAAPVGLCPDHPN